MDSRTKHLVAAGLAIVVVVGVGVTALGVGPLGGTGGSADSGGKFGSANGNETDGGSSDGGGDGGTATNETTDLSNTSANFAFDITQIEKCGDRCRNVTATLTNNGTGPAHNVTVTTNIYVQDDQIWQGWEVVGRLNASESFTSTKTVKVSYEEALMIQNNNGYITIETVVRFENGTKVFEERRQVA